MSWPARSMAETLALLTAPGAPFEMVETEALGRRVRSYVHMPETLRAVFDASRDFGARDLLVYEGERLSFAAHWRAANAFGRALIERFGVKKGDRVAVAMRNYPEWSICAWGALAVGAVLVPLNAWESSATLALLLEDCGAKVVVVDGERLARLAEARPLSAALVVVRAEAPAGVVAFDTLIGDADDETPLPDPSLAPDDLATIFYTSGTTGRPKGAAGTHRNILTNYVNTGFRAARAAVRRGSPVPGAPSTASRRILLPMPFFHVTGFHSTLMPALANGATIHLMYKWDVAQALDIIAQERINGLNLVPALAWQLSDAIAAGGCDTSSVDLVGYGGAAAAPELAQRMCDAFPNAWPGQGYGATETSSLVAANSHEDMMTRPGSVGTAVPCCDVRIVDGNGRNAPAGAAGELWVRGPNIVTGYWNMPEATRECFADGWYRTGDVARIDADGFLTILDRVKDMLIRGGENIYCVEIEDCLASHPDVLEAAVFGVPERVLGEVVGAAVRLREGAVADLEALAAHVRARMAAHKVPVAIDFHDMPLPRNAAGKLLKREMRTMLINRNGRAE
ncbi:class I adenylate-forming enzyme family protein [Sphingomonas sp. HITSZ_GF]|uniref:class I adenylate-forming enzyme family protein n=1 Tax=Sphingomonas sp. HITSZ_GF TaxID=3037247 RepID=UPI00240DB6CA|nr:class I adenylate-forming enzyme family protein [Sphingomonas sp. HITSZ_GF]MDG2533863.1 class I adenylate-forming enzyme family protein [Sphingomonas sp. HITSZ_GF]